MKLREKYSAKNRTNNYSSFWMDNDWNTRNTSIFDVDEEVNSKPKTDLVALAGYRRAISNFVTIGSKLDDKLFDPSVGLALHEGSHIKLSDFDFLRTLL